MPLPPLNGTFDENAVVDFACMWLESQGFQIMRRATTKQRGIDIVAKRGDEGWLIEAKGGTSARTGSPRHGKGFNQNQIIDRVMKGFYTVAALAETPERNGARIGFAMPRSPTAERYIGMVHTAMATLGITMLWVEPDGSVAEVLA